MRISHIAVTTSVWASAVAGFCLFPDVSRARQNWFRPEWTVESYQVCLSPGGHTYSADPFAELDSGDHPAWAPDPQAEPSPETIRQFLLASHQFVAQSLAKSGIDLPSGVLCAYDPLTCTLAARVRKPGLVDEYLNSLAMNESERLSKCVAVEQEVFEAPAVLVRDLVQEFASAHDHGPAYERVQAWVETGKAEPCSSFRIETQSGQRARAATGLEIVIPPAFSRQANNPINPILVGDKLEIEPVIGPDQESISLVLTSFFQCGPGFFQAAGLAAQTHDTRVHATLTVETDRPRILAVSTSAKSSDAGEPRMRIAFLIPKIVTLTRFNADLAVWIETFGEDLSEAGDCDSAWNIDEILLENDAELSMAAYWMPPYFFQITETGEDPPDDPFAVQDHRTRYQTARQSLSRVGVTFPKGAFAVYDRASRRLTVRNTKPNLDLVQAYMDSILYCPASSTITTLYIIQTPVAALRKMVGDSRASSDHSELLKILLEQAKQPSESQTRVEGVCWLETSSGERAEVALGRNFVNLSTPLNSAGSGKPDQRQQPNAQTIQRVGTAFEVEPVICADGFTLELDFSLRHHYDIPLADNPIVTAGQGENPTVFRSGAVSGQVLVGSGMARMIGFWNPESDLDLAGQDMVQAAFLLANIVGRQGHKMFRRVPIEQLPASIDSAANSGKMDNTN